MPRTRKDAKSASATVGYEAQLWKMADALRGSMDAAEYKHVVLGLIFPKYISDAFEAQHAELEARRSEGADPRVHPRPGQMDLPIRGINFQIAHGDSFHNDRCLELSGDFILANASMSSNRSGGGETCRSLIQAIFEDRLVALSGQLFCST